MRQVLALPDGGGVVRYSKSGGGRRILFIGRNQFNADVSLSRRLLGELSDRGFDVLIYESPNEAMYRRIHSKFRNIPVWPRRLLKGLLLLAQPSLWRHAIPANKKRYTTIEFRKRSFAAAVLALGEAPMVVARSAGGRIAASMADELELNGLICLGYPFKHPDGGDEPDRYAHLSDMKTPCLIVQGDADVYGGIEIADVYALSASVDLQFIPADHGMKLAEAEMQMLLDLVFGFAARVSERTSGTRALV